MASGAYIHERAGGISQTDLRNIDPDGKEDIVFTGVHAMEEVDGKGEGRSHGVPRGEGTSAIPKQVI